MGLYLSKEKNEELSKKIKANPAQKKQSPAHQFIEKRAWIHQLLVMEERRRVKLMRVVFYLPKAAANLHGLLEQRSDIFV